MKKERSEEKNGRRRNGKTRHNERMVPEQTAHLSNLSVRLLLIPYPLPFSHSYVFLQSDLLRSRSVFGKRARYGKEKCPLILWLDWRSLPKDKRKRAGEKISHHSHHFLWEDVNVLLTLFVVTLSHSLFIERLLFFSPLTHDSGVAKAWDFLSQYRNVNMVESWKSERLQSRNNYTRKHACYRL